MRLLVVPTLLKDELISVLRLIVLLTRDFALTEAFVKRKGVGLLFQYLKISSGTRSATGIQPYIAIIVRHIIENQSTLQHVMRQEIKTVLLPLAGSHRRRGILRLQLWTHRNARPTSLHQGYGRPLSDLAAVPGRQGHLTEAHSCLCGDVANSNWGEEQRDASRQISTRPLQWSLQMC